MQNKSKLAKPTTIALAGMLANLGLCTVVSARTTQHKTQVAIFHQVEGNLSETVILYADGKYKQSETQQNVKCCSIFSISSPLHSNPERSGTWRLLDKEGGVPIELPEGTAIPKNAVVELSGAMPFGMTWENQSPIFLHGDRMLPSASLWIAPSTTKQK